MLIIIKTGRDQFYAEGADWQDPNIPEREVQWLKDELVDTQRPVIVFCHHPLFEYPVSEANLQVNNYREIQEILQNSGKVIAAFQGHVHAEYYTEVEGIHYNTQLGMVDFEGLENNSFSIVKVEANQITIDGYKRVKDQTLNIG